MEKIIDVYTDGSMCYDTNTIYFGYFLNDDNGYTYIEKMTMNEYNNIVENPKKSLDSGQAELLGVYRFLEHLNNGGDQGKYNIYSDCQPIMMFYYDMCKNKRGDYRILINKIRDIESELKSKGISFELMWVESHSDCYGNLYIDNEINKIRNPKKVIDIDKRKCNRLDSIILDDYLTSTHGLTYSDLDRKFTGVHMYNGKKTHRNHMMKYLTNDYIRGNRENVKTYIREIIK